MCTHLLESLQHQLRTRGDSPALLLPSAKSDLSLESLSWNQLGSIVDTVREHLQVELRDESLPWRIGHASDNTLGDIVIALASMLLDAIEVPLDHRLNDLEINDRWNRVGGYWLQRAKRSQLLEQAWTKAKQESRSIEFDLRCRGQNLDQPALILWTSGTTGRPQGVTLSQRNLAGNAAAKLQAVPQSTDDVRLCTLPLSHAYARTCDFGTWLISGCTLALSLGFDAWQRLGPQVRPTLANVVPSLATRLLGGDPSSLGLDRLRLLGCGGAAMSPPAFALWEQRGVTVIQGYGLTETSPVICSATPDAARPGLVGGFVEGWDHQIRKGELFVKGPHNMLGYWGDQAATEHRIDRDGWLRTGDLVEQDAASGQLRILGRTDDVIVLDSARKLNPRPIEQEIEQIAGIRHAMLVAINGNLQLWIDGDGHEADINAVFQPRPRWQRPKRIERFQPPLSQAAGELTNKGTLRRSPIMEARFQSVQQ